MRTLCSQRKFFREATHSKINKGVPQELLFYDLSLHTHTLSTLRNLYVHNVSTMITSETPYKLAEIIMDTWPNLYRPFKVSYNEEKQQDDEQVQQ
jgi:hypothetical protein